MTERQALGRMGEDAAARLYTDAGYRVIERNRHESHNEIDLILENATSLVFVEVKTRTQSPGTRPRFGRPASAVDAGNRASTWWRSMSGKRPTGRRPSCPFFPSAMPLAPGNEQSAFTYFYYQNRIKRSDTYESEAVSH